MSTVTLGKIAILKRNTFIIDNVELAWIPEYENKYAISKEGKLWSNERTTLKKNGTKLTIKSKWIKPTYDKSTGYYVYNRIKYKYIHKMIAITWVYNPDKINRTDVDHENRIKTDNNVKNLRWLTHWENSLNAKEGMRGTERGNGVDKERIKEMERKRRSDKLER